MVSWMQAMECVMMPTTMPVATGIKVIAADQPKSTKSLIGKFFLLNA